MSKKKWKGKGNKERDHEREQEKNGTDHKNSFSLSSPFIFIIITSPTSNLDSWNIHLRMEVSLPFQNNHLLPHSHCMLSLQIKNAPILYCLFVGLFSANKTGVIETVV